MKTLNEVIYQLENCAYAPLTDDTLQYLKAYRDDKNDLTALRAYWKEQHENLPLTWDELNCMNGKPVWVEVDEKWWGRFWAFVEVKNDFYINFYQKGQEYPEDLWKFNMGKTWNAFRKERE